jgi:hypothetical protein
VKDAEIASFVRGECEEIESPAVGRSYRCAAYLTDGLYLPCVLVASKNHWVQLALRRFDETRAYGSGLFRRRRFGRGFDYASVVETFVAAGNRINAYDIQRLEPSPFALPLRCLREIRGETSMSWTQFVAEMSDSQQFNFGTTFHTEFFSMPPGYFAKDVHRIHAHQREPGELYRERPFFSCFIQEL